VPRRAAAVLALAAALSACVAPAPPQRVSMPVYLVGDPYQADGVWHYPRERWSYDETGIAVAAARAPAGASTANGEPAEPDAMTASHPTLQLPSLVRVTNLQTGLAAVVRVNDRGPGPAGRLIGLSPRAAAVLGVGAGGAPVRVELLAEESQLVAAEMTRTAPDPASLSGTPAAAIPAAAPRPAVEIDGGPAPRAARAPRRAPTVSVSVPGEVLPDGRFMPAAAATPVGAAAPGGIVVLAEGYERWDAANRALLRLGAAVPGEVVQVAAEGRRTEFAIRFGPLQDIAAADRVLAGIRASGQSNVRIVVGR
jgi:rare lipoprotein A